MESTTLLQLEISSQDQDVLNQVKATLKNSQVDVQPKYRSLAEMVTILSMASTAVKMVSDLWDLQKKIRSSQIKEKIVVKNADGQVLDLGNSSPEQVQAYVNGLGKS